jgi:murein DD-endopeptidase MepM/ murein hydrolase activator NlpD
MTKTLIVVPTFEEIAVFWPVPDRFQHRVTALVGTLGQVWRRGWHTGTDFACPVGTPVLASWGGLVYGAGANPGPEGIFVAIRGEADGRLFEHLYFHLTENIVRVGDVVRAGDRIGYSGNTGHSTGPHLHFQLQRWTGHQREFLRPKFISPPEPAPAAGA